jgi:hypothetical protein
MPETDAALAEERAHRAVPDEYPIFEQFSEVQAQKIAPLRSIASRSRGGERLRRCRFDPSLGVSSAGVGTCHEA